MAQADSPRNESELQRADRNLSELLQELRVVLPGVQVLFAFLLTVPFSNRFESLDGFQKNLYFVILLSSALTVALLVAPSANHRLLFHKQDKVYIVAVANRLALAGIALMAISLSGAILLISDLLFDPPVAVVATVGIAAVFALLWFVRPLMRRNQLADRKNGR